MLAPRQFIGNVTQSVGNEIRSIPHSTTVYLTHVFLGNGVFRVYNKKLPVDAFLAAGGGGGGGGAAGDAAGGGGGGGYLEGSVTMTPGSYAITIGAGGSSGGSSADGGQGANSTIVEGTWGTATAQGGGYGGGNNEYGADGGNGGGGGGGGSPKAGKTGTQANSNGLTAYKYDGGAGTSQNSGDNKFRGGGGGGAGGAGAAGTNFGKGGAGRHNTWYWGDTSYNHESFSPPVASGSITTANFHSNSMPMLQGHTGMYCRGGSAQNSQQQEGGVSGAPNTGNGGGGGASSRKGGKGGSGICMIRHKI